MLTQEVMIHYGVAEINTYPLRGIPYIICCIILQYRNLYVVMLTQEVMIHYGVAEINPYVFAHRVQRVVIFSYSETDLLFARRVQIFYLTLGYKSSICPQGKNLLFARRAYSIVGYTNI